MGELKRSYDLARDTEDPWTTRLDPFGEIAKSRERFPPPPPPPLPAEEAEDIWKTKILTGECQRDDSLRRRRERRTRLAFSICILTGFRKVMNILRAPVLPRNGPRRRRQCKRRACTLVGPLITLSRDRQMRTTRRGIRQDDGAMTR